MKPTNQRHILTRYLLISLFIFLLAGKILYNLFNTTVIDAHHWNEKAEKELKRTSVILPERGDILAADGSVLATNLRFYTVRLDYRAERFATDTLTKYASAIADSLCRYFPGRAKAHQWRDSLLNPLKIEKFEKRPRGYRVIDDLTFAEAELVKTFPFFNIKNRNRNGLVIDSKVRRKRPYGDMARRSIGGVGQTAQSSERHGISGLECALDSLLYGKPGVARKIALTRRIVDWADTAATPGYHVRTTIDINMQDIVENELNTVLETCKADWGVAVLMDVATGDIKAISNLEYNPKTGVYGEGMNRAVLGYEPGSVMKPISMLLALENGLVSNVNQVISTGFSYPYAGGRPITDSHGCQSMTVSEVIERSSNIGMTKIITGGNSIYHREPSQFYKSLSDIGFFEPMNSGIAGERIPVIEKNPSRISLSRMCYGYATLIPPLYTLGIYNAIANDGKFVRPRLYTQLIGTDTIINFEPQTRTICSDENALKLRNMLRQVVDGDHGTGKRLRNPYVNIAGKTGTCYMVDPATHQYNTGAKRLAFCGFFPTEKPLYSCIVLTCRPRQFLMGAASSSGQVLKNIALKMYARGMLNNSTSLRDDTPVGGSPKIYRSTDPDCYDRISTIAGVKCAAGEGSKQRLSTAAGSVPDVRGLGLRQAVAAIEAAGYNVKFNGSGYVREQSPAPGISAATGATVSINLI